LDFSSSRPSLHTLGTRCSSFLLRLLDDTTSQAKDYAEVLQTEFYATTDGHVFRLFRTKRDEIGSYRIDVLNSDFVNSLLEEIRDVDSGVLASLTLPRFEIPSAKIDSLTNGVEHLLSSIFDELNGKGTIKVTREGNVRHLSVKGSKQILGLEQHTSEPSKDAFTVQLDNLRAIVGDKTTEVVKNLSELEGFDWVINEGWEKKHFVWKKIKDIAVEDPNLSLARRGLVNWLSGIENSVGV
jgi:hypothetical protein